LIAGLPEAPAGAPLVLKGNPAPGTLDFQLTTDLPHTRDEPRALPSSAKFETYAPLDDTDGFGQGYTRLTSRPKPEDFDIIDSPSADKVQNPITSFAGPWSRSVSAQIAGSGVADLTMACIGFLWASDETRRNIHDTLDRVARDVCAKAKPGDDLIGNLKTAMAFALWGLGFNPDWISSVVTGLANILTQHFHGDTTAQIAEMGQYFFNHSVKDLLPKG
jgi:hypothetical protein